METKGRKLGLLVSLAAVLAVGAVAISLWFLAEHAKHAAPAKEAIARWFPEPKFLLDHGSELKLDIEQTRQIQVTSRSWDLQRAAFDVQLQSFGSDVDQALAELRSQKPLAGDYAKLVSDFDKARLKAWNQATKTLKPEQVLKLEKLRERGAANSNGRPKQQS